MRARYEDALEIHQAGKPKKPATCYFMWLNSIREEKQKERPDLSMAEFGKWTGQLWRDLPKLEQEFWRARAAEESAQFAKGVTEWVNAAAVVELSGHARPDHGPAKA